MSKFVLDASALLALINKEAGHEKVKSALKDSSISSVNLAEVATKLVDWGLEIEELQGLLSSLGPSIKVFDEDQAMLCAALRIQTKATGLSIGDRACLALAISQKAVALTADKNWLKVKGLTCRIEALR